MTRPTTANASKLSIWLGDGASTETFTAPCGLTSRGINFSGSANELNVPDCDDPDAPAWVERVIQSLSAGVNGSGVLAREALSTWETFFLNGEARNIRVIIDWGGGEQRRYDGRFICTTFNITGELGNKIQVEIALASDGEILPVTVP